MGHRCSSTFLERPQNIKRLSAADGGQGLALWAKCNVCFHQANGTQHQPVPKSSSVQALHISLSVGGTGLDASVSVGASAGVCEMRKQS